MKIPSDQSRTGQRRNRVAFMTQSVNWVLDADGRSFFDSVDHEWLLRMVAPWISDRRILRLIRGWLWAGVMEGQRWSETGQWTPEGSARSPLLATIFMHYALDLWVHQWRKRYAARPSYYSALV